MLNMICRRNDKFLAQPPALSRTFGPMLRGRIIDQYGEDCRIQQVRRTPRFASSLFVVDFMHGARLTRILGAIGRDGRLTEQSGMDLLQPERLVFIYERLMLLAFAVVEQPRAALLLGLGGGAMCRHLAAYLPECAATVVERDSAVIDLARRFFHISRPIHRGDAQEVVADSIAAYDVVLVDLYDGSGATGVEPGFWRDCTRALRPGGCLAVNWAAFVDDETARQEARRITAAAGRSLFLGRRALTENVVQIAPLGARLTPAALAQRWHRFALAHRLPREDRDVLKRCTIRAEFPLKSEKRVTAR
jgi:predicted O-methyltransferase YrrM